MRSDDQACACALYTAAPRIPGNGFGRTAVRVGGATPVMDGNLERMREVALQEAEGGVRREPVGVLGIGMVPKEE